VVCLANDVRRYTALAFSALMYDKNVSFIADKAHRLVVTKDQKYFEFDIKVAMKKVAETLTKDDPMHKETTTTTATGADSVPPPPPSPMPDVATDVEVATVDSVPVPMDVERPELVARINAEAEGVAVPVEQGARPML
jgi:hypothetical protein